MIVVCDSIFQIQHEVMKKLLITLCKNSNDRYHLSILIIIAIIYHIYIDCELYNLAYGNSQILIHEQELLKLKMVKWQDHKRCHFPRSLITCKIIT